MTDFTLSFTATGVQKEAAALAGGLPVTLTHIAFGGTITALPSDEVARVPIESAALDEQGYFVLTGRLPVEEGGFAVAHIGVVDSDGDFIAEGKCPEFYKPALEESGDFEYIVRIRLAIQNTECFTVEYDLSAYATVEYVDQKADEVNADFTAQRNETQTLIDQTNILVSQVSVAVTTATDAASQASLDAQSASDSATAAGGSASAAANSATGAETARDEAVAAAAAAYRDSDYGLFFPQNPAADDVLAAFPMQYAMEIPIDWGGSVGRILVPASAGVVFDIKVDGVVVGTITFAPSATSGTFSSIAATAVAAGSILSVETGSTSPSDYSDISIILRLQRTA